MLDYALNMVRMILIALLCAAPLAAAEDGYRIVHPDGTVEFTDQPTEGAEPITLPEVPTYSAPASTSPGVSETTSTTGAAREKEAVERAISIVSPGAEETVWFDAKGMIVSVQVTPALAEGEQVLLRLDGAEVARGSSTSFTLHNVYRGSHMLSAALLDQGGSVIGESSPITFYMRQHVIKQ